MKVISLDNSKKPNTREARGTLKKKIIKSQETMFLSIFWDDILRRFNICSKKLQSVGIDLGVIVKFYNSLITYVSDLWSDKQFEVYKFQTNQKCGIDYFKTSSRIKRKMLYDEGLQYDSKHKF